MKRVVLEWVLTNGKLPGFQDRVKESHSSWKVVDKPFVVYRSQGGDITHRPKGSPGPGFLTKGIRPVIATSKTAPSTLRYAGEKCCVFAITLQPGTRYLDVGEVLRDDVDENAMKEIRDICPSQGAWPTTETSIEKMIDAVKKRCDGRIVYKGTDYEEYILPEHEVMVYGLEGDFSPTIPTGNKIIGKALFKVSYGPGIRNGGKRGRTFRSKALRRNKNGHRLTHKSQDGRNRRS